MPGALTVCDVDLGDLVDDLPRLAWESGGEGVYAMIDNLPAWFDVAPIATRILTHFPDRRRGITLLSRLVPGQRIPAHRDFHDGGTKVRVHVPLTTNRAAWFCQNTQAINMKVGKAYRIDPSEEHSVVNNGETDRVHLILSLPRLSS